MKKLRLRHITNEYLPIVSCIIFGAARFVVFVFVPCSSFPFVLQSLLPFSG
jgi:hypothetical protein